MKNLRTGVLILFLTLSFSLWAQEDRFMLLKQQMDLVTSQSPGLEEPVDL